MSIIGKGPEILGKQFVESGWSEAGGPKKMETMAD